MKRGERGAALLTVLLLVAVMAVLSASALEKLKLSTRLAANAGSLDQARAFSVAAESIATGRISDLVNVDPARTTLAGGWNGRETRLPLPGGLATATVRDGGNCFNLNSVVDGGQEGQPLARRPLGVAQFTGLMTSIGIGAGEAARVAGALADWIDTDTVTGIDGAEDSAYADRPVPYKTANAMIADPSELRAVAGVTPELYEKLRPFVCALPVNDLSPINVNTLLPGQAPLFAMLAPDKLTLGRAAAMIAARPAEGYPSIFEFWRVPALGGLVVGPEVEQQTTVRTRWFSLALKVELGDTELTETALIDGGRTPARLVRRSWGEPG